MIHGQSVSGIYFPASDKAVYRVLGLFTNSTGQVLVGKSILNVESERYKQGLLCAPGGKVDKDQTGLNALDGWCEQYLLNYFPSRVELAAQLLFIRENGREQEKTVLAVYRTFPGSWPVIGPNPVAYDVKQTKYMSADELIGHPDAPGDDRYWLKPVLEGKKVVASFAVDEDFRKAVLTSGVHTPKSFSRFSAQGQDVPVPA